jgi:solute carrier family 25 citrate transporter 1
MTSKNNGLEKSLGVHLLAGTGAGFVESIIMHPLDTLKTRFQAERCLEKVSFSRIWTTTSSMIQQESVWSLYKGFGPVCSIITPKVALQFGGLNFFKQNLQDKSIVPTSAVPVIAGIFTGIVQATFLLTPFELIKVRQQTLRYYSHYTIVI